MTAHAQLEDVVLDVTSGDGNGCVSLSTKADVAV